MADGIISGISKAVAEVGSGTVKEISKVAGSAVAQVGGPLLSPEQINALTQQDNQEKTQKMAVLRNKLHQEGMARPAPVPNFERQQGQQDKITSSTPPMSKDKQGFSDPAVTLRTGTKEGLKNRG